ncbi:MAG: PIG-L family deacetylase, partial [Sinomicrobium sp.]|nr:PIG-L family deacetylase [Sinomicrobium sp.]
EKPRSAAIYEALQKLNFLGSALYVAAHPDDENTRLISYFSSHLKARTAYLSVTRGDGGQNLIGPELRELLGVLRTQELLAARRIDGGEQRFTRANDFGYSKHPEETFRLWNKNEVLADVVWAIRTFKPDIIINRFDHRTPGASHGHHTASAMLSTEAFDLANDKKVYPEQLQYTSVWQPKRLFFNTSWWFYGSPENFEKADKSAMVNFNVGTYFPLKGMSNNEIAALSRSQHRCQGFGSIGTRGDEEEYLEFLKGDFPADKNNLFDGINTTWIRVKGGKAIGDILYAVEKNFNFTDPSVHIPDLLEAYKRIEKLEDEHWRTLKSEAIREIIAACAGLYLEAVAEDASANPGEAFNISLEAINRSNVPVQLKTVTAHPGNETTTVNEALTNNSKKQYTVKTTLPASQPYTAPYWLTTQSAPGLYNVSDQKLIGCPETPRAVTVTFSTLIRNVAVPFTRDVVYKYREPSKGEIYEPFQVLPPVTAAIVNKVNIFSDNAARTLPVKIKAGRSDLSGSVSLHVPSDWSVSPGSIDFSIARKDEEKTLVFTITPPRQESEGYVSPLVTIAGKTYTDELVAIRYDHIPKQSVLLPSKAKIARLDIQKAGENIGYIMGAGDEVPESLRQIGYNVLTIDPATIEASTLKKFDAVVVGIRAYNVVDVLKFKQKFLLDYVKEGGNLIVQYNTAGRSGLHVDNLAPYELDLSRDRVTEEDSEVQLLAGDHSLLNFPNKIGKSDFDGWVQERGLYFPGSWGTEFTPILSIHDKGESPKNGSLLVAPYGEGHYIYTGLSFFRELPAGVPGAYKLFANMLSVGKAQVKQKENIKG